MCDLPQNNQEDLLYSTSGGFDFDDFAGYPQNQADAAQTENDILDGTNIFGLHPGRTALALLDPASYQRNFAQADSRHFAHLAGPQLYLPRWQGSSTDDTFSGAHGAGHDAGQYAPQVVPQDQAWNQNTGNSFSEARDLQTDPQACCEPTVLNAARPERQIARVFSPEGALQQLAIDGPWSITGVSQVQQVGSSRAVDIVPNPSLGPSGIRFMPQEGRRLGNPMMDVDIVSDDVYSQSSHDFGGTDIVPADTDLKPSNVPPPQSVAAPSKKSVVCPVCKQQLQDRPGLRHHLDIHDPVKTSRNKCDHENCNYASRYPKDVRRHKLVHEKNGNPQFICSEPGCDREFYRNDFLLRHRRRAHQNSLLTVPKQRRRRATSSSSTTASFREGNSSATVDRRVVQQSLQTIQTPVRPSLMSLRSASAVMSTDGTHDDSAAGLDLDALMPTPSTAFSSFTGSQYFSATSPSECCLFSTPGSPCPP